MHPAKSHPEVIIQAVAARDRKRAEEYARKHNILQVIDSYDGTHFLACLHRRKSNVIFIALLDHPSIDAVYIPLPAGLHCEWALKAISKGRHVIIEKPATVNAAQSELLFRSPLFQQPNAPVLLEAIHFSFQPTWQHFLTLVDRPNIDQVDAIAKLPFYIIHKGGIRFNYELGGGCLLELGTYPLYALRKIMGDEPDECTSCKTRNAPPPHDLCDEAADAVFQFRGGRIGNAVIDLRAPITTFPTFTISVLHKETKIEQPDIRNNQTKSRRRKLILHNFLISSFWHRIDIEDEYKIRDTTGKVLKIWTERKYEKINTFNDAGLEKTGEPFWNSYRHQLEQFVNRVRGREGSGLWVEHEDSIAHARMIDMAYEKSSLPLR